MKFETLNSPENRFSPLVKGKSSCACSDPVTGKIEALTPPFVTGYIKTSAGDIPVVATELSTRDKWETVKARVGSFRMNYSVKPGLYAVGSPDRNSDVFVTANYKMSFDALRSALRNVNGWIMVLDTKGINVWCAAGKGTFGTSELLRQISRTRISELVDHRKLILPQLGAPGVSAGEVKKRSGFKVMYGPVLAEALTLYLSNNYKCTDDMRRVRFSIADRLILTPIELRQISARFPLYALIVLIIFGLTPEGIIFKDAVFKGLFFLAAGLLAIFTGSFFTPVFLPFIPFRSFALKGWVTGMAFFTAVFCFSGAYESCNIYLLISAIILFPLFSSYMALQFTGASTYTSLSGVKKELKTAFPVYISGAVLSFIFLIIYKISDWGLI